MSRQGKTRLTKASQHFSLQNRPHPHPVPLNARRARASCSRHRDDARDGSHPCGVPVRSGTRPTARGTRSGSSARSRQWCWGVRRRCAISSSGETRRSCTSATLPSFSFRASTRRTTRCAIGKFDASQRSQRSLCKNARLAAHHTGDDPPVRGSTRQILRQCLRVGHHIQLPQGAYAVRAPAACADAAAPRARHTTSSTSCSSSTARVCTWARRCGS